MSEVKLMHSNQHSLTKLCQEERDGGTGIVQPSSHEEISHIKGGGKVRREWDATLPTDKTSYNKRVRAIGNVGTKESKAVSVKTMTVQMKPVHPQQVSWKKRDDPVFSNDGKLLDVQNDKCFGKRALGFLTE